MYSKVYSSNDVHLSIPTGTGASSVKVQEVSAGKWTISLTDAEGKAVALSGKAEVLLPIPASLVGKTIGVYQDGKLITSDLRGDYIAIETDKLSTFEIKQVSATTANPSGGSGETFKLFGKESKYEKTPLNYFLLVVCFGWIWMNF